MTFSERLLAGMAAFSDPARRMLALLLLLACACLSGITVARLLAFPTRVLLWSIAATLACAQIIGTVQILSLVNRLEATWLLWSNVGITFAVGAWFLVRRPASAFISCEIQGAAWWRDFYREVGTFNVAFALGAVLLCLTMTAVAPWVIPAGDPYHLTMCLAWMQNETITAFPVYDPRLVAVVFGSEALALPGLLYLKSSALFVLFSAGAAIGSGWLIYALTRSTGATRKLATFVAAIFLASAPLLRSVWASQSDFLLSTFWLLTGLLCLVEARKHPRRTTMLMAFGSFTFAMACGAKNTILLHGPAYALAALILLRTRIFHVRTLTAVAVFGFIGALASGVVWSYAQNAIRFGDWRGPEFLRDTLAKDYSPSSAWTRLARTLVTTVYDCGWLPSTAQPEYLGLNQSTLRVMGARDTLQEDKGFYSFDPEFVRPGNGFGMLGPLVLLPALIFGAWFVFARRRSPSEGMVTYRAVAIFAIVSFLTFCIVLRTQRIGISRLMLSAVSVVFPLTVLMLPYRIARFVAVVAVMLSALMSVAHGVGFALNRHAPGAFPWLGALKRATPAEYTVRWGEKPAESMLIREPYTTRELHAAVEPFIQTPATVGLIAGFNAEAFRCFGPNFSNRVHFLNDYHSGKIVRPPEDAQYLFVEDFDVGLIPAEEMKEFAPLFRAAVGGQTRFAVYERTTPK